MQKSNKQIQRRLRELGYYQGAIDGLIGPISKRAIVAFKKSRGLRARAYVGPITLAALFHGANLPKKKSQLPKMPSWLKLAYSYKGLREYKGPRHNATIVGFWERLGLHFRDDETPWCAGFVNAVLDMDGQPIPKKYRAAALGWRWTGHGYRLNAPVLGAIMSMTRPGRPGSGHTTFVLGRTASGKIAGLGGNQGNMVGVNEYDPVGRDAQFHLPAYDADLVKAANFANLPLVDSNGMLTNEA